MAYAQPIVNQEPKENETFTFTKKDIENLALEITKNVRASLVGGKVPEEQLPSYVDDVLEGYYYNSKFYEDAEHQHEITAEEGKIYINLTDGNTYRWSGTLYVAVGTQLPDTTSASAGNALVLDADKEPIWSAISGGTKLYLHTSNISVVKTGGSYYLCLISTSNTPLTRDDFILNENYVSKIIIHNSGNNDWIGRTLGWIARSTSTVYGIGINSTSEPVLEYYGATIPESNVFVDTVTAL